MSSVHAARRRGAGRESGMATAEYAVGTVAAACIGCILVRLAQGDDPFFWDFLTALFDQVRSVVPSVDGFPGPHRPWLM
ncbi:MAG: DUF4244 domain-containing protein [Nocardioidaceae bacterium]